MNHRNAVRNEHGEKVYDSYKSYVEARARRNSSLQNLVDFLACENSRQRTCQIACIDFSCDSDIAIRRSLDLKSIESLSQDRSSGVQGRLFIVEDLHPDIIETLGSVLNLDHFFLSSHIEVAKNDIMKKRPCTASLPSMTRSQNFLTLRYHRVIEFEHFPSQKRLRRDMNVSRKAMMLPSYKGVNLGLARHCCSVLRAFGDSGLWFGKNHCSSLKV